MTRRPKTVAELDAYQRTVLAGLMARREYDQGCRLSARQRQTMVTEYLAALNAAPGARRPRASRPAPPSMADYRWQSPTPARRPRGR